EFNEPSQIFTDEPMEFDVSTVYGDTHLAIVPIPITEMEAEYTGNVHLFETIDPEQVEVNLIYEDGMKKRLDAFDVEDPGEIEGETKTVIHTDYGDADLVIHPVAVDKVEAVYDGYVYETEPFSKDAIHVVATMVDGYSVEVTDFDCGQEKEITDETDINIKTDYGEAKCHIIPVRITSISSDAGTVVAGGQVAIHKIYFQYEDESVKEISSHEVKFTDDTASQVLQEGNNIFKFEYKGKEYELNIPAVNEAFAGS
ncbi:MAG: hypothetical protein J6D07_05990, partial [Mogibacterium sp.]|nr:hypothetical protein [Mogibacterium sp.]